MRLSSLLKVWKDNKFALYAGCNQQSGGYLSMLFVLRVASSARIVLSESSMTELPKKSIGGEVSEVDRGFDKGDESSAATITRLITVL